MDSLDDLKIRIERIISELEEITQLLETDISDPQKAVQFGQVKEIEASIARLQKQGLPVPIELKELKIKLFSTHENHKERTALNQKLQQSLRGFFKNETPNMPRNAPPSELNTGKSSHRNPYNYQRPLGGRGFDHLDDYLIPAIKLMWSGRNHTEAFHMIAQKLDVRCNSVYAQCTKTLDLTTHEFVRLVESKAIVALLERKFPGQYQKIKAELKS
jgi:hypothetical protein